MNISNDKLNSLLNIAGKKLGQDPAALKAQLEAGNLEGLMQKMDPKAKEQINSVMNDPGQLEALMANEKIKNLIEKFTK